MEHIKKVKGKKKKIEIVTLYLTNQGEVGKEGTLQIIPISTFHFHFHSHYYSQPQIHF